MRTDALMIFVRNPELGKVKTRLAAEIGDKEALFIYCKLLKHTSAVASHCSTDVFVFGNEPLKDECWNNYNFELQIGNDLGEKMFHAFDIIFKKGYEKVIIIGSDCPGLSPDHVKHALLILDKNDIAIGPATDGGYYLLGMKNLHTKLFQNIQWSTDAVFTQTSLLIKELNLSFKSLSQLSDLDVEEDLPISWRTELASI